MLWLSCDAILKWMVCYIYLLSSVMVSRDVNQKQLYHLYDMYIARPRDEDEHVAGKSLLHACARTHSHNHSGETRTQ